MAHRGRVLMQVTPEDDNTAADGGVAGERNIAAKDEQVSSDRTIEKNMPGEDAHAAVDAPIDLGRTQKTAHIMEGLAWGNDDVLAEAECVSWRLCKSGERWKQKQRAKDEAPWKHTYGFLGNYVIPSSKVDA